MDVDITGTPGVDGGNGSIGAPDGGPGTVGGPAVATNTGSTDATNTAEATNILQRLRDLKK